MKKINTLADLDAAAARHSMTVHDAFAELRQMDYYGEGLLEWETGEDLFQTETITGARLETWGYQQLVDRLDAPTYHWLQDTDRCPPDLEQNILDRLIKERAQTKNRRLLLRLRHPQKDGGEETIRAVLSDEYTPFDNADFVDMVGEALDVVGGGMKVGRAAVGDTLRAHLVLDDITFDLPGHDGGGLHPGIYLANSEIGTGRVRVAAGIWRQVCTNGVIYGWDAEWNRSLVHRYYTVSAFKAVVADMVAAALQMSREAAERFVESYNVKVQTTNVERVIMGWIGSGIAIRSRERAADLTLASARSHGRQEQDLRLYDLVNGMTEAAQMADVGEEQEKLERAAGDLLANWQRSLTFSTT